MSVLCTTERLCLRIMCDRSKLLLAAAAMAKKNTGPRKQKRPGAFRKLKAAEQARKEQRELERLQRLELKQTAFFNHDVWAEMIDEIKEMERS